MKLDEYIALKEAIALTYKNMDTTKLKLTSFRSISILDLGDKILVNFDPSRKKPIPDIFSLRLVFLKSIIEYISSEEFGLDSSLSQFLTQLDSFKTPTFLHKEAFFLASCVENNFYHHISEPQLKMDLWKNAVLMLHPIFRSTSEQQDKGQFFAIKSIAQKELLYGVLKLPSIMDIKIFLETHGHSE